MWARVLPVFAVLSVASAAGGWLDNELYKQAASDVQPHKLPRYTLDLDAAPEDRWTHIAKDFLSEVPALQKYLASYVPAWALPIVEAIGRDIEPYFTDYGEEMKGIAKVLGLDLGEVVAINLIYQIESLGLNCSNWNNTGPTHKDDPGCMAVDPNQEWCYCHNVSEYIDPATQQVPPSRPFNPDNGPGLCTSLVARDTDGTIWHGRNLDWNLDSSLLGLAIDVDFQRNNVTVFSGATLVGFVGVFNGMSPTYSGSIDARGKGGLLWQNILESLLHKSMTPSQHLRKTLESATSFPAATLDLASQDLINEVYYIVAGREANEGLVISRGRVPDENGPVRTLNDTDWYLAETNYDWWEPVPTSDDRRTPVNANLQALTQANVNATSIASIMHQWPTFNFHTDYTGIFNPSTGSYSSIVWY
mmetsp:Transcript_27789/g.41114  ORF Transcript_27789/g.41114 Transcript_27789/m.41114 type:complete len:418 (-) Transcript_27789:202-1455(-)|eukprot:CAMPEP_0195521588 /NCGR_PEP_ID=MMETSP0794_2-20130614/18981_1 /TAXON_ID=515487 /ORGANISM="Stephanopyxis turris, Strain CCMP 815" /LENGTH=417 /DNA_ID=CAMNT_0040651169 /DNA_START=62 /DNA_END=1315 /DNA_ORIENTATION=+